MSFLLDTDHTLTPAKGIVLADTGGGLVGVFCGFVIRHCSAELASHFSAQAAELVLLLASFFNNWQNPHRLVADLLEAILLPKTVGLKCDSGTESIPFQQVMLQNRRGLFRFLFSAHNSYATCAFRNIFKYPMQVAMLLFDWTFKCNVRCQSK